MLQRLGVRGKLLAVVMVPVLVLVAAVAYIAGGAWLAARDARDTRDVAGLFDEHAAFVQALQTERAAAVDADPEAYADAQAATDAAMGALGAAIEPVDTDMLDGSLADLFALAATAPEGVSALRAQVAGVPAAVIDASYSGAIMDFAQMADQMSSRLVDRELARVVDAYGQALITSELLEHERVVGVSLAATRGADVSAVRTMAGLVPVTESALSATQDAVRSLRLAAVQIPTLNANYQAQRLALASGDPAVIATVDAASFDEFALEARERLVAPQAALIAQVDSQATATLDAAIRQVAIAAGAGALAVILSLIIAFSISRRIVNPLRRLTTTATAVRDELPRLVERVAVPGEDVDASEVQIPVESRDEVGRLAEAFNGVNAATLEIAREQAALRGSISEMFVNVARRDQVLLNRQLSRIDEMERTEDDPTRLTKLFALDHLATRMRRNSESLLVLAGIETGRRLRRPMPLSDVIRTASSEIELYERIDLDLNVDPAMRGHQALAAAHLFAELLENATVFSDPGSRVVVRTGRIDGDFTIEVIDTGIGMTPEELVEANARVRSTAASEILGAQRLGLFVVGRIAKRLGAEVALASEEGRGTVATVLLPASLFEAVEEVAPAQAAPTPAAFAASPAEPEPVSEPEPAVALPFAGAFADTVEDEDDSIPMPAGAWDDDDDSIPVPVVYDLDDSIPLPADVAAMMGGSADEPAEEAADEIAVEIAGVTAEAVAEEPVDAAEQAVAESEAADEPETEAAAASDETVAEPVADEPASRASGLPSRRRRQDPSPAEQDERTVIGLPVRATADQLTALDAEAAAFTPSVSPSEVAPQTPEERASMFRGFHARGEAGPGAEEEPAAPVADTSWPIADAVTRPDVDEDQVLAAWSIDRPVAEVEETEAEIEPVAEVAQAEAPEPAADDAEPLAEADETADEGEPVADVVEVAAPEAVAEPAAEAEEPERRAAALGGAFAALDAIRRATAARRQPAEEPSTEIEEPEFAAEAEPEPTTATFAMPKFTDVGVPESPLSRSPYGAAFAQRAAHVEEVPQASAEAEPEADLLPEPAVPTAESDEFAVPVLEFDGDGEPADQPEQWEASADEAVTTELEPTTEEQADEPWLSPLAGFDAAALGDAMGDYRPAAEAEEDHAFESAADEPQEFEPAPEAGVESVALDDSIYSYQPAVPEPEAHADEAPAPEVDEAPAQASGHDTGRTGFFGRLFGRGRKDPDHTPVPLPLSRPAFAPTDYDPLEEPSRPIVPPASFSPDPDEAPEAWPEAPPTPEPVAHAEPEPEPAREPAPTAFTPGDFTPQEMVEPAGWETAGESALAAADHDFAPGTYQPVIDTEHSSGRWYDEDEDVTRAAFSEFSSLTTSRPKVEKTEAGLQRRKPAEAKPAEVTPIEDAVSLTPKERDAEAVRSRFSAFYSGTQRAREDAAELEFRSTPQPANE